MKPNSESDLRVGTGMVEEGLPRLLSAQKTFAAIRWPGQNAVSLYVPDARGSLQLRLRPFDLQQQPLDASCRLWEGEAIEALPEFEPAHRALGQTETERGDFLDAGAHALAHFKLGGVQKAVLSAVQSLPSDGSDGIEAFESLCHRRPDDAVFWFRWPGMGEWMGSSPECLLERTGPSGSCDALAGTKPLDPPRSWTPKEVEEQQWVADDVRAKLTHSGLAWSETASERVQGALMHRLTRFSWNVPNDQQSPTADVALLEQFHPTPAVGGWPRDQALELIAALETHQRRLYSGYFAVLEPNSTRAYVVLRCAERTQSGWQAYAGGGWTSASSALEEWNEIELKMKLIQAAFES